MQPGRPNAAADTDEAAGADGGGDGGGDGALLDLHSAAVEEVSGYYDDWAAGYNADLARWGYEAPAVAVDYLSRLLSVDDASTSAPVLDAGCGTGLVGRELADRGFDQLVGIDVSSASLDLARESGRYRDTHLVDLNDPPLPFDSATFSAVICVGVLSYVPNIEGISREFARITQTGGVVVLTQRSDLFVERNTRAVWEGLGDQGVWDVLEITDQGPYMPHSPDSSHIDVHYGVFRRR